MQSYFVYILSNKYHTVFYTGVTNDINRRIYEHQQKLIPGFTSRYNIGKLLFYEETTDINVVISREKQLKDWRREKKLWLIHQLNPEMNDLAGDFSTSSK